MSDLAAVLLNSAAMAFQIILGGMAAVAGAGLIASAVAEGLHSVPRWRR